MKKKENLLRHHRLDGCSTEILRLKEAVDFTFVRIARPYGPLLPLHRGCKAEGRLRRYGDERKSKCEDAVFNDF